MSKEMARTGQSGKIALRKMQFFHTWLFYYLYSADHKFMKALLKQKFSNQTRNNREIKTKFKFPHVLFGKEMRFLANSKHSVVDVVYGKNTHRELKEAYGKHDAPKPYKNK